MEKPPGETPRTPRPQKSDSGPGEEPRRRPFGPMTLMLIAALLLGAYFLFDSPTNRGSTVPYLYFFNQLEKKNVLNVTFYGEILTGSWREIPEEVPEGFRGALKKEFNTLNIFSNNFFNTITI